jgi:hypothetical protein
MDDMMLDLTAGNQMLRRRLDAYADARLSPDMAAATRMRARVMASAHRQAALTAAGAGLTVLTPTPTSTSAVQRRRVPTRRLARLAGVLLSAALGLSLAVGSALAADAGGTLYPARLGLETLLLPSDPSERALAELSRLENRLREAQAAGARGDAAGVAAAMEAYASIVQTASAHAIGSGDAVAGAALEAGVARNIAVLEAILKGAPAAAEYGLTMAIESSDHAVDAINGNGGDNNGSGGGDGGLPPDPGTVGAPGAPGTPATPSPSKKPATTTPEPTSKVKPTKQPTAAPTPEPTARPTPEPTPEAEPTEGPERTPRAERTPRTERTPPAGPPEGPGQQGDAAPDSH